MTLRRLMKRLFLTLAVAGGVLALGTCALFTDSLFPWFLSGVTDTLDLSTWIDDKIVPEDMDENEWGLDLAVLRDSSGNDRVFVAVYGFQTSRLVILDADLSLADGASANPIDGYGFGRRALVDASGQFVVGSAVIDPLTLAVVRNSEFGRDQPALSDGVNNYGFWVDNGMRPAVLYCQRYSALWDTSVDVAVVDVSTDLDSGFEPLAVAYDGNRPAGQRAVLLLRRWQEGAESSGHIVYINEDVQGVGITPPVIDSYPGFSVTPREGVERMHYTRKGIVVRQHNDEATLYRFSEGDSQSLSVGSRHQIIEAYDIDGEYFYMVDKDARMLYKGRTGW